MRASRARHGQLDGTEDAGDRAATPAGLNGRRGVGISRPPETGSGKREPLLPRHAVGGGVSSCRMVFCLNVQTESLN